jgi:signal transduction histidine kinase
LAQDRAALAADRGLALEFALDSSLPLAQADPKLITQVLTNLLTNAVNYTPSGGHITLSTGLAQAHGSQWVTISVSDTGPGIPATERPQLFERFYRGTVGQASHAPGTGLGLAICKEIMDLHHGRVTLEDPFSQPDLISNNGKSGHGSTFLVWLPVVDPEIDQTVVEEFERAIKLQPLSTDNPAQKAVVRGSK